ncbi:MAG TPA: insulinase family protein [Gemmatimonadaceae bacterium]|nr:insulinase family protein [Gemmatimonadaceae bacterium]
MRRRSPMLLAAIAAAAAALVLPNADAAAQQAPPFPTSPPPAGPVKPATFPPFQEALLPNGVRVVLVERHDQPVLSLSMSFPAGEVYAPAGKEGLAGMTAGLLTKGAGTRSAEEIASLIEGVGGSIEAAAGPDFLTVSADVLSGDAALAFTLLGDVVARPTFPDKEVELQRTQTLSALQLELSSPASIAQRTFQRVLYGQNPYARSATPASVRAIGRADLARFQATRLRPSRALLVVAGDITMARVKQFAAGAFKGWTGSAAAAAAPAASLAPPPARTATQIVLVNRPGSVQANILAGNTTFGPADPRFYAATVANKVLGGGADARLFDVLREKKGWTYGAYSSLARNRGVGYFQASAEVRTEVADSALAELLSQLKRIGTEPVPSAELDAAKNALVGSFPLSIETAGQVASQVSTMKLLGLPADYLTTYRTRLAAVTAAQATTAARTTVRPGQLLIVVVGDGAKLYPKLTAIAPVTIVAPDGTPMSPSAFTVKASALDLDMSKLVPRTDSFAVMVQGNPLGFERTTLEKVAGGGYRYTEQTQIASFVQQTTELTFSDKVEMQALKQTGKVQGQDTKVDVTYASGRVTGSATVPTPQGVKTSAVDATLPTGALDDNAVQAIVPALRWSPNATFTINVFSAGKNAVRPATLTVTGTDKVAVPAGTFDAYRAELTGSDQPVTLYVTSAAPYRIVKIAVAGTPLEIVLVK